MKIKRERLCQILHADPVNKHTKKEKTPAMVLRYLEARIDRSEDLQRERSDVNQFERMHIQDVDKQNGPYVKLHADIKKFMEPLRPQLIAQGCKPELIDEVSSNIVESYMLYSHRNPVIGHLTLPEYAAAHLYIRADIPLWKTYLPQVREGKILPNWMVFHQAFNSATRSLEHLAPTTSRKLFRGMNNTTVFKNAKEGEHISLVQPSSCAKDIGYAEKFMHPDLLKSTPDDYYKLHCSWSATPAKTDGDMMMQIWDVQDSINISSVGGAQDSSRAIRAFLESEHLLLKGTQLEVLLKETAIHPKSHRPVTFIVAQDVRSKELGQKPGLLEALDLEQKK